MFYDEFYSLEHGPICSNALNGINGRADSGIWRRYISLDANKRTVRARARNEFPRLSASDLEVINSVWKEFGHKSTTAIRKWTHDHCPEYTPVETGRVPINYKDMFEAVGYANASDLEDSISQYRRSEALLDF